jgi:hypothetical protein
MNKISMPHNDTLPNIIHRIMKSGDIKGLHMRTTVACTSLFALALIFSYPLHTNAPGVIALATSALLATYGLLFVHYTRWMDGNALKRTTAVHMLVLLTVLHVGATSFFMVCFGVDILSSHNTHWSVPWETGMFVFSLLVLGRAYATASFLIETREFQPSTLPLP